jgi:hypothetical protein
MIYMQNVWSMTTMQLTCHYNGHENNQVYNIFKTKTKTQVGLSMIGVPPLKHKYSLLRFPNSPFFFTFPMTCLIFHLFSMSNEIILFQILCWPLKYLFFSLMKVMIIKFIQCGHVLSTAHNF